MLNPKHIIHACIWTAGVPSPPSRRRRGAENLLLMPHTTLFIALCHSILCIYLYITHEPLHYTYTVIMLNLCAARALIFTKCISVYLCDCVLCVFRRICAKVFFLLAKKNRFAMINGHISGNTNYIIERVTGDILFKNVRGSLVKFLFCFVII